MGQTETGAAIKTALGQLRNFAQLLRDSGDPLGRSTATTAAQREFTRLLKVVEVARTRNSFGQDSVRDFEFKYPALARLSFDGMKTEMNDKLRDALAELDKGK